MAMKGKKGTGKFPIKAHLPAHGGKDKMAHSSHHQNHGDYGMGFGHQNEGVPPEAGSDSGCYGDDDNAHQED